MTTNAVIESPDWPTQEGSANVARQPASQRGSSELGIDLRRLFLGHKVLLIACVAVGLALGYLKFTRMPAEYASNARILVVSNDVQLPVDGGWYGQRPPIDTHLELMRTPVILEQAVEKLGDLSKVPSLAGSGNPLASIAGGLTVSRSSLSDEILNLTYSGPDPDDCQRVLNAVIGAYVDFVDESRKSLNKRTFELITEAKEDLQDQLTTKEQEMQEFREGSTLVWEGESAFNIHSRRLSSLEGQRTGLHLESTMLEAELTSIQEALKQGIDRDAIMMMMLNRVPTAQRVETAKQAVNIAADPDHSLEFRLLPLQLREQALLTKLGTGHPEVIGIKREIEMTRSLYLRDAARRARLAASAEANMAGDEPVPQKDILQTYLESLTQELAVIARKTAQLDEEYAGEHEAAQVVAIEENRHRALTEDLQRTKRLFDVLLEDLQEIGLVKDDGFVAVKPVDKPGRGRQIAPLLTDNLVLGGLLGLLAGFGLSFLLEISDRSFRGPEQIVSQLGLPVIGHIPTLSGKKSDHPESQIDPTLVAFHAPRSRLAESYRAVRVPILFAAANSKLKVLQLTSPDPGDGKSTMAANLAIVMANSGKRCILIDCDFRRPKAHKLFKLDNQAGFSSVIQEQAELADAIRPTEVEHLDLLTTGPRVKNPAELILSPRFDACLAQLREQYDFIIVDTPPVLAVTDAAAVASKVDAVLLVIRITKRVQLHAARARETLELIGANILGVVVNGIGDANSYAYGTGVYSSGSSQYQYSKSPYYAGYGYRYGYRDYYSDKEEEPSQSTDSSKLAFAAPVTETDAEGS